MAGDATGGVEGTACLRGDRRGVTVPDGSGLACGSTTTRASGDVASQAEGFFAGVELRGRGRWGERWKERQGFVNMDSNKPLLFV